MKTNLTTRKASFSGKARTFADTCLASCQKLLSHLARVKAAVLAEFGESVREDAHLLDQAINEAEALAWQTGFPQLFFPELALEKARGVVQWRAHEQVVRRRSPQVLAT